MASSIGDTSDPSDEDLKTSASPGQDHGFAAYCVLFAVIVLAAIPLGIILSFGVFFAHYQSQYDITDSGVWIGTLSNGVAFLLTPPIVYICVKLTPNLPLIHYAIFGWLLNIVALLGAAFSTTIPTLIITQGLLLGSGVVICENPMLLILNTWFVERRGWAYGIYWASCDGVAVAFTFLADYLLKTVGQKTTFIIFAAIVLAVPGPCLLLLRERGATSIFQRGRDTYSQISPATASKIDDPIDTVSSHSNDPPSQSHSRRQSHRFYTTPHFHLLSLSSLLHALSFYIPQLYLPTYALTTLDLPSYSSPLLLALSNSACIIGQPLFGYLSDRRVSLHALIVVSSGGCVVSALGVWAIVGLVGGEGAKLAVLCLFAMAFGVSGSGMMALWARMGLCFRDDAVDTSTSSGMEAGERSTKTSQSQDSAGGVAEAEREADDAGRQVRDDSQLVYSWLCFGRGIGVIVSGPLSEGLLKGVHHFDADSARSPADLAAVDGTDGTIASYGSGHGWRNLVIFVAVLMLASAVVGGVAGRFGKKRERRELRRAGRRLRAMFRP